MASRGWIIFVILACSQAISLIGSSLTSFALGVWVYRETGSVTQFALLSLFLVIPGILISPLAGVVVDRWDRQRILLFSDLTEALGTLAIAILFSAGSLEIWHLYVVITLSAICTAFQMPALTAVTTILVPPAQLGRANGLLQVSQAVAQISAPLLGALLLVTIDLSGVIALDVATFLLAALVLLVLRIPRAALANDAATPEGSLRRDLSFGWRYIRARPGLLLMLALVALTNLTAGGVEVLITPLILTFASVEMLGTILSVGGLGLLAGSGLMLAWGGPRRRIYGALVGALVSGLVLLLGGIRPSVPLVAAATFIYLFCVPIVEGCTMAIWQSKIPVELQGRVFSTRRMVVWSTLPIGYIGAGQLADRVFEPLLAPGGGLAGSIGQIIGVGPGRGIGLIFVLLGLLNTVVAGVGLLLPRLRNVERELPDAASLPNAPPAPDS